SEFGSLYENGLPLLLACMAVLTVGAIYDDSFALWLRRAGLPILVAAEMFAACFHSDDPALAAPWIAPLAGAAVATTTLAYAYIAGGPAYFYAGLINMCLLTGRLLY